MIASFLVIYAASIVLKPLLHYFRDKNGLRKYLGEYFFLSGISGIGHNWEVGRKHKLFHTKQLHDKSMKEPVIRIDLIRSPLEDRAPYRISTAIPSSGRG